MGIQSTRTVSREWALNRVELISTLAVECNFREIQSRSYEDGLDIRSVKPTDPFVNFTNDMLSEVLDLPFYRESLFENYLVVDDV